MGCSSRLDLPKALDSWALDSTFDTVGVSSMSFLSLPAPYLRQSALRVANNAASLRFFNAHNVRRQSKYTCCKTLLTKNKTEFTISPMKVSSSLKTLKKRDRHCQVVRRKGRLYVINKRNPRFKARQG